jgi:thiol-disulfide isomerase/thioredoxin
MVMLPAGSAVPSEADAGLGYAVPSSAMRTLVAVLIGLAIGIGAAVGIGVALVVLTPVPTVRVSPSPSPAPPPASPSASTAVGASAIPAGASASPQALASGSAPTAGASHTTSPFPLVDRAAPPLSAPQVGGGTIDLAALRGKPVWVVFTGTYCTPCRDEYALMNGFAARYADTGLVVVAIHVREGEETVAPFISSVNVAFPVGLDLDGSRARAWDAAALPVHYFIDAQGIVRDAALGGQGPVAMARGLQAILPGVTVTP